MSKQGYETFLSFQIFVFVLYLRETKRETDETFIMYLLFFALW